MIRQYFKLSVAWQQAEAESRVCAQAFYWDALENAAPCAVKRRMLAAASQAAHDALEAMLREGCSVAAQLRSAEPEPHRLRQS